MTTVTKVSGNITNMHNMHARAHAHTQNQSDYMSDIYNQSAAGSETYHYFLWHEIITALVYLINDAVSSIDMKLQFHRK